MVRGDSADVLRLDVEGDQQGGGGGVEGISEIEPYQDAVPPSLERRPVWGVAGRTSNLACSRQRGSGRGP